MKILVLPTWYPTQKNPNGGVFVIEAVRALVERGIDASILFVDLDYKKIDHLLKEPTMAVDVVDGIPTYRAEGFGVPKKNRFLLNKWSDVYFELMEKYLNQNGVPDLIHAHSFFAGYAAMRLAQKYNIPYVVTEHFSAFLTGKLEQWKQKMIREVFDNAAQVIAVSKVLKNALQQYTSNTIEVIPNSINTQFFKPQSENISGKKKFQFITVGGVRKEKQYGLLVEAFEKLPETIKPKVSLKIIGNGPLEDQLIQQIANLSKENDVQFLGELSREGVLEQLQQSDVFVCSSAYETFGVAILEAMSVGLPVVSTKCGGPELFINEKNGVLTSIEDLTARMSWIFENMDQFDSKKISAFVETQFGNQAIVQKRLAVYKKVIQVV